MSEPAVIIDFQTRRRVDDLPPGFHRFTINVGSIARDRIAAVVKDFIHAHAGAPGIEHARCFAKGERQAGEVQLCLVSVDLPAVLVEPFREALKWAGYSPGPDGPE